VTNIPFKYLVNPYKLLLRVEKYKYKGEYSKRSYKDQNKSHFLVHWRCFVTFGSLMQILAFGFFQMSRGGADGDSGNLEGHS
jgi:hypothetical protein